MGASRIRIRIVSGGLEARAAIEPGAGAGMRELRAALENADVVHGVDESTCARLAVQLSDPGFATSDRLVAQGSPPVDGSPGTLELCFVAGMRRGTFREDGSLDFHERGNLKPVPAGEVVARCTPPTEGVPGRAVDGSEIPAKAGSDTFIHLGEGVALDDRSGEIRAIEGGVIEYREGELLDVGRHHEHRAGVDLESGNLQMEGSLSIMGDVAHGFSARASTNVEVNGVVDCGTVYAEGDLVVTGGVIGGEGGRADAGGDALVHHTHTARVRCAGRLEVQKDAVNSELRAHVIVVGGRVVGGELSAEVLVSVGQAGTAGGAETALTAGEALEIEDEQPEEEAVGTPPQTAQEPRPTASDGAQPGGEESVDQEAANELGEAEVDERAAERERRMAELREVASIEIVGIAHAGVTIRIGNRRRKLESPTRAARFRYDPTVDDIVTEALAG